MVAISLYRGNLHRVPPNNLRQWLFPPPVVSLLNFKILTQKRSQALALLPPPETLADEGDVEGEGEGEGEGEKDRDEEGMGDSGASDRLHPQGSIKEEDMKDAEPLQESELTSDPGQVHGSTAGCESKVEVKMEVTHISEVVGDKENRKTDLEKNLQVMNEKKHHLVQMLKQILHAEEELKRRNTQLSGFRASIPIQPETAFEMGSVTKPAQKLSVEVNFGSDLDGEANAAPNHNIHPRNMNAMNSTSPSAASLIRTRHVSIQQNTVLHNPGATTVAAVGHGQHTPTSKAATASTSNASVSPSPFSPTVTPRSAPGTNFNSASTPSPAASGGVSSVFRDSRLTTSL